MGWIDSGIAWTGPGWTWVGSAAPRSWRVSELASGRANGGRTIAFPMRLDAAGRVATIPTGSERHAAECAGHILSCEPGERGLAPGWGTSDPSGQTVITPDTITATVTACQPDLVVSDVRVEQSVDGQCRIRLDAQWAQTAVEA